MKKIIYIALITIVFVSCEKEVFTGVVENTITEYGKLFVSSNPNGYKIFIDNKNMAAVTPDTVLWLSEGTHKLTLMHDIFTDTSMTVDIKKLTVQTLLIDMLKNPRFYSKIYCTSVPTGAKIFLNDQPTNYVTPVTISNLYPGSYKIKFVKDQCRADSSTIQMKGGESSAIQKVLEDTSRTVSYRMNNSKISSNVLSKVVVDPFNNKWIGSIDHGLMKFDGKNWTSYENAGVITGTFVQDLLVDKKGRLWVGTSRSLTVFDGISWQSFTDKLPYSNVIALEEDINGNIWIETPYALVKYNGSNFQVYNLNVPFTLSSVTSSKNGDIWVGTNGSGILRYDGNSWTNYLTQNMELAGNISNIIKDLIVNKNGMLYSYHAVDPSLKLVSALLLFDGENWTELKLNLLFAYDVASFYLDNDNNIWMALNVGLEKYNPSQPPKFYDSDTYGYFSKQCSSFTIDLNGDGWLTTMGGGIAKLKKGTF